VNALQHRSDALEPSAGVDTRPRQRVQMTGGIALVLHEDQVPNFDRVVASAVHQLRQVLREIVALEVVDLTARATWTSFPHCPEVVLLAETQNAIGWSADLLPEPGGIVVIGVDREPQTFDRQTILFGDQIPCELDRVRLEVVAEREVAEHLEERVVTGGVADVVEVVVLAAGANTFLAGRCAAIVARVAAKKDVFELVHARIGEQECCITGWDQRGRRYNAVSARGKEVKKRLADLLAGRLRHGFPLPAGWLPRRGGPVPVQSRAQADTVPSFVVHSQARTIPGICGRRARKRPQVPLPFAPR
jgi:hypothetical protein